MNCTICHRPPPNDVDLMIDEGCAPYYYRGRTAVDGPVCPDCCLKYLRLDKQGEWEAAEPRPDAHWWN